MADKKISQLTTATEIDGSELIAVVKNVNGINQTLKTSFNEFVGIKFPENPIEGDTYIATNNDYYLYENSKWNFIPSVKIKTVIEQFLITRDHTLEDDILQFSKIMSEDEIVTRLEFTIFDIYSVVGYSGIKKFLFSNKEYRSLADFLYDLKVAAGSYTLNRNGKNIILYEHNIYVVYKEKINTAITPLTTYSNGLFSIMKGRKKITQHSTGVQSGVNDYFTNWSKYWDGNFLKYLMNAFWNIEVSIYGDDMIWYSQNLKTLYNQYELNTEISNLYRGEHYDHKNNAVVQNSGETFTIVNQPKVICSKYGTSEIEIMDFGFFTRGYRYIGVYEYMVLIYPCKVIDQEKYGFMVKPLGVDQVKIAIEDAENELNSDDIMLELKFDKTKHKIYKKVTNSLNNGYFKRIKLFSLITSVFEFSINTNTLEYINIFTINKKTKTRSNLSNAYVKLHTGGVNKAACYVSKRN